jgi:hypothetical protein
MVDAPRGCARPYRTRSGQLVRCGSRAVSLCQACAELYRGDWAAILRSGVFDGPVAGFRFFLLTLTAPSFGRVHRVPRGSGSKRRRCGCGLVHGTSDAGLRGVPIYEDDYDYAGAVAWNRDSGVLWDRTRRRLRDRWASVEYGIVREWQDRGALHLHLVVRIALDEAPESSALAAAAQSAVAFSNVDGCEVGWGEQVRCDQFRADGNAARAIWYLSKALNYVLKDVAREAGPRSGAWRHLVRLDNASRSMRCGTDCVPGHCGRRVHERFGARSHVVSVSRRTKHRPGWSFSGLTRRVQREHRRAWVEARSTQSTGLEPQLEELTVARCDRQHPEPRAGTDP